MSRKLVIGIGILIFCVYVFLMVVVSADRRDVYTAPSEYNPDSLKLVDTLHKK